MRVEKAGRDVDPRRVDGAVAIDELDVLRRAAVGERGQPGVAGARGGERLIAVQLDDLGAQPPRRGDAAVGRSRIDVDHPSDATAQRGEARLQASALVAADDHGADPVRGRRRIGGRRPVAASEGGRVVHASVNSVLTAATQAGADPSGAGLPRLWFTKPYPGRGARTEARCRTASHTSPSWPGRR